MINIRSTSTIIGPCISNTNTFSGMLRFVNNNVECYNNDSWEIVNIDTFSELDPIDEEVITWARTKMQEEEELIHLLNTSPTLKKSYEKFEMIKALVQTEVKNNV